MSQAARYFLSSDCKAYCFIFNKTAAAHAKLFANECGMMSRGKMPHSAGYDKPVEFCGYESFHISPHRLDIATCTILWMPVNTTTEIILSLRAKHP